MELHRRLKEEGHITFNRQYLGQLANEGRIPFKTDDKDRKIFKYLSVLKALHEDGYIKGNEGTGKTVTSTKLELYHWRGQLAKLKHDVDAGILMDRAEVEEKAFIVGRVLRDQLLALPERLAAELIDVDKEEVKKILHKELEIILDELTPESLIP